MEKNSELDKINKCICAYYQKYSNLKSDDVLCYKPDKRQISSFYESMKEQFTRNKLKSIQDTKRLYRGQSKIKNRLLGNIKNPLSTALPKKIQQNNQINYDKTPYIKMTINPMFSGVQSTKKGIYKMNDQVREIVSQDIQKMVDKKQEELFRRKFPVQKQKSKHCQIENQTKTQKKIKAYNKMVNKYRYDHPNTAEKIKLVDQNHFPELSQQIIVDNQYLQVIDIFKKLYMENQNNYINEGLMKYILKFQKQDKLAKKVKIKSFIQNIKRSKKSIYITSSDKVKQKKIQLQKRSSLDSSKKINNDQCQRQESLQIFQQDRRYSRSEKTKFKGRIQGFKSRILKIDRLKLRL